MIGSHPRSRRARPGQRDPGSGGRAPARLRAWRGRPHRRGHGRRLQALRARPPTCRLRRERDAACPAGDAAPGAARACRSAPGCSAFSPLIAIYVPVTGAGPSIQRAGVMGAAGVVAALAGRPRSRWYAILLAAFVTLAINPRASGDAGWQLSFAAVIGILLWAGPIRDVLLGPLAAEGEHGHVGWRRGLAEGAGVTIAATLSTAPLMAHDFEAVSLASVPANLLALPAVAPLMWLGMLAALVGQLPWLPVQPLTGLAGLLAAYVAQVAHWLGSPGWARASVPLPSAAGVLAAYAALALALWVLLAWARRRGGLRRPPAAASPSPWRSASGSSCLALAGLAVVGRDAGRARGRPARRRARRRPGRCDPARPGRRSAGARGRRAAGRRPSPPARGRGGLGPGRGGRHPRPVRPCGRDRGAARLVPGPPAALRGARPGLPPGCARRGRPRDADRRGVGDRFGKPADRGAVAAAGRSRRSRADRSEPGGARAARPVAGLPHASHGRRGGRGGADRPRSDRRPQGGSPRLGRRRPRFPARPQRPASRGDLRGSATTPTGIRPRARSPPSPSTTSRSCARTSAET